MTKLYSYKQLGSPKQSGDVRATDGVTVKVSAEDFAEWSAIGFAGCALVQLFGTELGGSSTGVIESVGDAC